MTVLGQGWLLTLLVASPVVPSALDAPTYNPTPSGPTVAVRAAAPAPVKSAQAIEPVVGAKSALVVDLPSNETLYSKDAGVPLPIASITKLMTALLTVENTKGDEVVTIHDIPITVDESQMGLKEGEQWRTSDLLAGLLVASANDGARALAKHIDGSDEAFVKHMNARAAELGLKNTHFGTSSGFDKGESYSSAQDLAVLSRVVIAQPRIRQITGLKELALTPVSGEPRTIKTSDNLIGGYLPIAGLKTGTTDEAGQCLISWLNDGDRQLLAIVLNSPDRFQENKSMLDWALHSYRW